MIASESVLLPEPFGPMIACTEPLSTTRSIPLRIVLPSTLTTRSLISRLDMHTLPRRGLGELGEGHAIECLRDAVLQLEPDRTRAAIGLTHAVQDGLSLGGTDLGLDRSLERAHDVTRRDLARLAGEDITAGRAALPVHETGLARRGDELLEIGLGQVLSLRDGVQRDGPLAPRVALEALNVRTGVGAMPRGQDAVRAGAHARARAALERSGADVAFGLEGGAILEARDAWLTGHVVAVTRDGRLGEAAWGRMLLPHVAAERLRAGEELGDIIDDLFERKESKRQAGAIGILTEGAMSRTDAFAYLVAMACAPFLHPELYAS